LKPNLKAANIYLNLKFPTIKQNLKSKFLSLQWKFKAQPLCISYFLSLCHKVEGQWAKHVLMAGLFGAITCLSITVLYPQPRN